MYGGAFLCHTVHPEYRIQTGRELELHTLHQLWLHQCFQFTNCLLDLLLTPTLTSLLPFRQSDTTLAAGHTLQVSTCQASAHAYSSVSDSSIPISGSDYWHIKRRLEYPNTYCSPNAYVATRYIWNIHLNAFALGMFILYEALLYLVHIPSTHVCKWYY